MRRRKSSRTWIACSRCRAPTDADRCPCAGCGSAFTLRFMLGDLKGTREVSEQALARSVSDPSCRCEAHHAMGGTLVEPWRARRVETSLRGGAGRIRRSSIRSAPRSARTSASSRMPGTRTRSGCLAMRTPRWRMPSRRSRSRGGWITCTARRSRSHMPRCSTRCASTPRVCSPARKRSWRCASGTDSRYYGDWAQVLIGWARGQERPAEGVEIIESALDRLDRNRAQARRPYYLSLLAETYSRLGNRDRAASILDAAITMALERGDVWWLPALYLQKSELEPAPEREATLRRGLALARAQNSRGLEQRILASSMTSSI